MLIPIPASRADANESAFIQRALNFVESEVYYTDVPPLEGREYVPVDRSAPEGAKTTSYRKITRVGKAVIGTSAGDASTSVFFTEEYFHQFHPIRMAYQYTYDDLLAAAMASSNGQSINIDLEHALSVREAIEKTLDTVAAFGSATPPTGVDSIGPDVGWLGLLNQPNANVYVIPVGAGVGATTAWATKTPDEIIADLSGIVAAQVDVTYKVHRPKRIITPVLQYEKQLAGRGMGDGRTATVLSYFVETRKASEQPVEVRSWINCKGADPNNSGQDMMVAYDPNRRFVRHMISQEFIQMPPQLTDETYKVPCRAKTCGVVCPKPLSISYSSAANGI